MNDGSGDRTAAVVQALARRRGELRLLSHYPNRGRGFSIREGVFAAGGDYVLETDADGSTGEEAIGRFLAYFTEHPETEVLIGSREQPESKILASQPFLRVFLGKGFIYLAKLLFWSFDIRDFTLGFKMFRSRAARDIFARQYDDRFVAEAEIVFVARARGWKVKELPVSWDDSRESRVQPIRESFRSFWGLLRILGRAAQGRYR